MTSEVKGRVLGVGGVFFRSPDPGRLAGWYSETLGFETESWGKTYGTSFSPEAMPANAFTVCSIFARDTEYFGDKRQSYMINLVVDDLDAALPMCVPPVAKLFPRKKNMTSVVSAGSRIRMATVSSYGNHLKKCRKKVSERLNRKSGKTSRRTGKPAYFPGWINRESEYHGSKTGS